jgi:F-type H+-transporting ATPase subunit epsilon
VPGALFVEILTPEAALFSGEATALVARSSEGDFTVMANHTAMVSDILPGVVRVQTADGEHPFVVHGGYFQVGPDGDTDGSTRASVLAGIAEALGDVDVARATEAKERAEATLAQRGEDPESPGAEAARSAIERAELRLSATGH